MRREFARKNTSCSSLYVGALTAMITILLLLGPESLSAQCTFTASNGSWSATVNLTAVELIPDRNPCPFGYNYNLKVSYTITFSGNPPGSNVYDLYAEAHCGSEDLEFQLPKTPSNSSGTITTTVNPWTNNTDCATATPTSMGCGTVTAYMSWVNLSLTSCTESLPIVLSKFEGRTDAIGIMLEWETLVEKDFSHFEIERADTEELQFEKLTTVQSTAKLGTGSAYRFIDQSPSEGRNYYRLKFVDLDGTSAYSRVINMNWEGKPRSVVYPNPAISKKFSVQLSKGKQSEVRAVLVDAMGNVVLDQLHTNMQFEITVPESVPSGLYTLRLLDGLTREVVKVSVP